MAKLFDLSQLNPIKLYFQSDVFHSQNENLAVFNPNYNHRHMDNDFFARNLKSWQDKVKYYQPYQQGDTINLMWLGVSMNNYTAYIVDCHGKHIAQIAPTSPGILGSDTIYLLKLPLWNIDEGIYFIQLRYANTSTLENTYMISEPIDIKAYHEGTMQFKYKNSFNDQHVIWSYGNLEMCFRVHCAFTEMTPQNKSVIYENEPLNPTLVSAIPYREWLLNFGYNGNQIPEWLIDKLERIFSCDTIKIDGKYFTRKENSQFSQKRIEGHPLANYELVVRENENRNDVEVDDRQFLKLGHVPITDLFYIKGFYSTTVSSYISAIFETYFKGQTSFVNYLNTIYLPAISIVDDSYFAIDEHNELILSSTNSAIINAFASLQVHLNGILPYGIGVESIKASGTNVIQFDLNNTAASNYAIVWGDGTQINYTSYPGALTQAKSFTAPKVYKSYIFLSLAEVIIITSNLSIFLVGGNLPINCEKFDISGSILTDVKNNLFLTCNGSLSTLNFAQNKLSTDEVDKLLMYMYDALNNNSLAVSVSNFFNSDNQSPIAPPSNNIGIGTFISSLTQNSWTITTD